MPTYSYGCKKCGTEFEVFRPMASKEEVECPICGFKETERIYSSFNFMNGSGCGRTNFG